MKVGSTVVTGEGKDCYMGTVVKLNSKWVTIKYLDFKQPRIVPRNQVRVVGQPKEGNRNV